MKRIVAGIVLTTMMGLSTTSAAQVPTSKQQNSVPVTTACTASTPAERLALNAAKNEARQMAEIANGGLTVYRAEAAMHGAATLTPCAVVAPGVWQFTFKGGEPTAVALGEGYTVLSVVTVDNAIGLGRGIDLEYNGPIADYTGVIYEAAAEEAPLVRNETETVAENACIAGTQIDQRALNAAKNTARQAAERANGGLSVYRAEPAMHGAVTDAPCERVGDNSWRFTFRGGNPTAVAVQGDYSMLSVVTVEGVGTESTFVMEYNGPIEDYAVQR